MLSSHKKEETKMILLLTGGANLVGHLVQETKVLAVLHATASSNDTGGRVELRAIRLLHVLTDKLALVLHANSGGILMGGCSVLMTSSGEGSSTDSDNLDAVARLDGGNSVT